MEVPTFLQSVLTFEGGALPTVMFSCDTCCERLQETGLEIYGSTGTLVLSHASKFGGKIQLKRPDMNEWATLPTLGCYSENCRGLGVADMVRSLRQGLEPRLSNGLIYHVLDTLLSIDEAWKGGTEGRKRLRENASAALRPRARRNKVSARSRRNTA